MAFNKSKALESALKYLNQGKIAQAISEYQQILRYDAKDQATLMTVGDLYARQGDMANAIEYFERLAQVYLSEGFNSKAIAIYKKIAKLAPAELAPLERLADLYVQQGVLSEARPLFLQIAEAHLKANRSQRAVEVLHRLLEVEPENPRVQMRLAELYNVMGQKKEASQTYVNYAQRLLERGETDEAQKLVGRALEVEPSNVAAVLLKGKVLIAAKDNVQAIKVLATHPEADTGGEVTDLLVDLEIEAGHTASCAERARKQLARGHLHFGYLLKLTDALIDAGQTDEALPLLRELREPMVESGEQDRFIKSLTNITQKSPEPIEALELLVDFCRHSSDPFRLNAALAQLADAYEKIGNYSRAEKLLEELVDRSKNDERIVAKLNEFRARKGGIPAPSGPSIEELAPPVSDTTPLAPVATPVATPGLPASEGAETAVPEAPPATEPPLDEETERYISQALTDVDLFSSYGLTQKATHLLENVLQRAPRHTPTLERLLDLYLGAGDERRTAETAALLEQIYRQRNDTVSAEHFAELKQRFQKVAGLTEEQLPTAPPPEAAPPAPPTAAPETPEAPEAPVEAPVETSAAPEPAPETVEFEVPVVPPEAEPEQAQAPAPTAAPEAAVTAPPSSPTPEAPPAVPEAVPTTQEVDLSDEWEAMAQEVTQAPQPAEAPAEPAEAPAEPVQAAEAPAAPPVAEPAPEAPPVVSPEPAPEPLPAPVEAQVSEPAIEAGLAPVEPGEEAPETIELIEEPATAEVAAEEPVASTTGEATPVVSAEPPAKMGEPVTADDLIGQLVAEIEHAEMAPEPVEPVKHEEEKPEPTATISASAAPPPLAEAEKPEREHAAVPTHAAPLPPAAEKPAEEHATPRHAAAHPHAEPVTEASPEVLNELADVFQEFRSEMGELDEAEADADLETHYNLGIAYREMGLLDEAIGEFQKVSHAVQKGKPFAYTMNCATLLALSFMDKGEPRIASMWYKRALETPGLEQESVLALRYDLGVALESAGESKSALDSFQQVYAMNIDYRDVAERIAAIQKHETRV
jgi:tetratricopeptide (TPR) repeat protein